MVRHGRRVGAALTRLGSRPAGSELAGGLAVLALLDRYWSIVELMEAPVSRAEAAATIATAMVGIAGGLDGGLDGDGGAEAASD
jgi:hypothetical protein